MAADKIITIALDAMGGDNAPAQQVKGAVEAVNAASAVHDPAGSSADYTGEFRIRLFGDEAQLKAELRKYSYDESRIEITACGSVIENCDVPTSAIRHKKDSSMVQGLLAVKNDEADAFISCGSTGALLVGGQTIIGRLKGVERAALAFIVPSVNKPVLIMDCGANADAKPEMLLQWAVISTIYMQIVMGESSPRVGILNIGEEEEKGNKLVKEAFPLLKDCKKINFTGSIESRGISTGEADVVVCDGFTGNVVLKMYEGVAASTINLVKGVFTKNLKTKIGALLLKNELKEAFKQYSAKAYGGAPMLGLKKLVVKPHGNSEYIEIKNAILQCVQAVYGGINTKMTLEEENGKE